MTKGPEWLPWNVGDYLKDTTHLNGAEHGAYCLLIMHYWKDGGLPDSEDLIRRKALMSAEQWIESRPVLAALFDEGWKHKRIEAELAKAAEIISKRKSAAQQRHSIRSAHAEHEDSTSSYAGVPPLPEPLPNLPPSSVPEAAGARDLFAELWEAFPKNPASSESAARKSFDRLNAADREATIPAADHYAKWFAEDCEARDRTIEAGLRFVPFLAKWLDSGDWKKAPALPIKASRPVTPTIPMTAVDQDQRELWAECERLRGRKAPTSGFSWKWPTELVDRAKANLKAKPELEAARAT